MEAISTPITGWSQIVGDCLRVFWSEQADIERMRYGPTDLRTDTPSYRDARTHLIMIGDCLRVIRSEQADIERMRYGPTDGRTDTPSYTDARTHLIMVRGGV